MRDKRARENLRKAVQEFRERLPNHIQIQQQLLALRVDSDCWVDVIAFEQQIDLMQKLLNNRAQSEVAVESSLLDEALQLYEGDFLQGFSVRNAPGFDAWQLVQQARLREKMLTGLKALSHLLIAHNEVTRAIETTRRILSMEPWREGAHRQLMVLLAQSGQSHEALVQYESCRRWLEQELDVSPSAETVRIYQHIRIGELEEFLQSKTTDLASISPSGTEVVGDAPPHPSPGKRVDSARRTTDQKTAARNNAAHRNRMQEKPSSKLSSHLFGIDEAHGELLAHLQTAGLPWLLSIDGIGGIGKTSLAQELVNSVTETEQFEQVLWVSAKQEVFHAGKGIQSTDQSAMNAELLIDLLLEQLTDTSAAASGQEKERLLHRLFEERTVLVVIDNLETVSDYEGLMPTLRALVNPSKFLITSRHSLAQYEDVFCLTLGELTQADAFALLRHEASTRGIRGMIDVGDDALAQITDVVGGHPLALNLVIGQINFLPLGRVLENLRQATGQHVDELYTYIYWQAWQALEPPSRQLFLAMPMLYNATYAQLAAVSQLGTNDLHAALTKLVGLSLVQFGGDFLKPRYRIHRLTETFLMHEVIKWDAP